MNIENIVRYKKELATITNLIDIGCSDGAFSYKLVSYFENFERIVGIDPIDYPEFPKWEKMEFYKNAVGPECKQIDFFKSDFIQESSISLGKGELMKIPQKRMDCFLEQIDLPSTESYFVKIDVQGHDLPALKSFGDRIKNIKALYIESWMKPFNGNGFYFSKMIKELDELNFYVVDFFDPVYRKKNGHLGQIDLLCFPKSDDQYAELSW